MFHGVLEVLLSNRFREVAIHVSQQALFPIEFRIFSGHRDDRRSGLVRFLEASDNLGGLEAVHGGHLQVH